MRFEGTLTSWNDERGFGRIESSHGGEPIFVHVSVWPRGHGRPQLNQAVTFEIEQGPKGKRARNVQLSPVRRPGSYWNRDGHDQSRTGKLFLIPLFLAFYVVLAAVWKLPLWVAALYFAASAVTFIAYAADKFSARRGAWRTRESTLHTLALAGGWPGALAAQQLFRHKSTKPGFRRVFWTTVVLNVIGLVVLASPIRQLLLPTL